MQHLRFDALQTSHHEERLWNGHEDGATVIDVDVIDGMLDNVAAMEKFLKIPVTEPDVSKIQFMTDSFKFRPDLSVSREFFVELASIVKNHGVAVEIE
ncbi:putative methionine synthase [Phytophthora infestans]|uniref:Putative methionine synthase n=1 Tax=Phytophthora infestans TaxID=4787 RepID=A0A833SSN6_PHYIN|nr:putative methionine synthase [Phytophthora infestans]